MKKIISLFVRDYEGDRLVRDEMVPGAEWVAAGEGVATRKYDGTCCLFNDGVLFKRYDAKAGKTPPPGFVPAQEADPVTGHWPGWILVGRGPADRWHREACDALPFALKPSDGTYELIGPEVQNNPERERRHMLIPHGKQVLVHCPRDFSGVRDYLSRIDIEGIVWHHPDGRMVKIKQKDFGLVRS